MSKKAAFAFDTDSITSFSPLAEGNGPYALDLLSTSQTNKIEPVKISDQLRLEIDSEIEQSIGVQADKCERGAPYIFFEDETGRARIVQGCCNSWECERCGQIRARHEYGRVLNGARELAKQGHDLYFWTLTCRGADMPLEDAQRDYLKWTGKLLDACRTKASRAGDFWAYVQITERQQRGHPHSHLITTWCPPDAIPTIKTYTNKQGEPRTRQVMASAWFAQRNASAGLGSQHEITLVDSPEGVAVYLSKYFFKSSMQTIWPKGWRRVRYSRSWPKLPEQHPEVAFPLVTMADWHRMEDLGRTVWADSQVTLEAAYARLITCVVLGEGK